MPTTGVLYQGTDIGSFFASKGASTAAATGIKSNGTDLNAILLARADGIDIGFNTGIFANGTDLRSIFGAVNPNTPLPINGNSYSASSQSATASTSSTFTFSNTSGGWTVGGSSSSGGVVTPGSSGSHPAGASTVQFTLTLTNSTGTGSTTNTATTPQPVSSSVIASVTATSTPATIESDRWANVTIVYYNASSVAISTTAIQLRATAQGAA